MTALLRLTEPAPALPMQATRLLQVTAHAHMATQFPKVANDTGAAGEQSLLVKRRKRLSRRALRG